MIDESNPDNDGIADVSVPEPQHRSGAETIVLAGGDGGGSTTPGELPTPKPSSTNIPATKYWVFNETGNIMVASTADGSQSISPKAQDLFEEVAVFFAALTKAVAETPRPGITNPTSPLDFYTLFDYAPIDAIVRRSGMFVEMGKETVVKTLDANSLTINLEFVESLLGFAATDGADLYGVIGVLQSLGQQATFSSKKTSTSEKMGHLLFVCEYMLGMPLVSAQYYYLDEEDVAWVATSPCGSATHNSRKLTVHKETYLFVPPPWIAKYGADLASVAGDLEFGQLVYELESYIDDAPVALNVRGADLAPPVVGAPGNDVKLTPNKTYVVNGLNFGAYQAPMPPSAPHGAPNTNPKGTITIGGVAQPVVNGNSGWTNNVISFTATVGTASSAAFGPVVITTTDGKTAMTADYFEVPTSAH